MQRKLICLLSALLFGGFAVAQQTPAKKSVKPAPAAAKATDSSSSPGMPSEETVMAFMKQMFGFDSQLQFKVLGIKPSEATGLSEVTVQILGPQGPQNSLFYVTADGKHAVAGEILPFGAKPFEATKNVLAKGINGPSRGPKDAPVLIVEFSDLQCPHCKDAQPILEKLLADEPNVRFVFQSFPLSSHNWAAKAAAYADCVNQSSNDAFWKFVQKTYQTQAEITPENADEKLTAIATDSGAKGADVAACAAKPDAAAHVEKSLDLGKSAGVKATPAVYVNGRPLNLGMPADVLKQVVDYEAKQAAGQ
jgi:protein-disulfide isomerase